MQYLTKDTSLEEMYKVAKEDGVFVIQNYLEGQELEDLKSNVLAEIKSKAGHYEFGRNLRGGTLNSYPTSSAISKVFNAKWMKDLYLLITGGKDKGYGVSVYGNHDYVIGDKLARNGWLHFDRNTCWKYFIYLTDIDQESGAFTIVPKSHKLGEELHKTAWQEDSQYSGVKNRIELDYPYLLEGLDITPIEEKAGTLIAFNTDCFHKGGQILKEGKERVVIRLNSFK